MNHLSLSQSPVCAIIGAGGNTGSTLCELLLDAGLRVIAIDHSEAKLQALARKGASIAIGSVTDSRFLTSVFRQADAAYTMIPPNAQADDYSAFQEEVALSIAEAVQESQIKYVVNLSILGANMRDAPRIFKGLHELENLLNRVESLNVVHLRPTYFMENLLLGLPFIKDKVFAMPFRPKLELPLIATRDIAFKAAELFTELKFSDKQVIYLLGKKHISMEQASKVLAEKLGIHNLMYIWLPKPDARKALLAYNRSESLADLYLEMFEKINEGIVISNVIRRASATTETSFEFFVKDRLVPAYRNVYHGIPVKKARSGNPL